MLSKVEKLQRSVVDFISRREALRNIAVVADRSSSLDEKFDEKLAPKIGLSVIVKRPELTDASIAGSVITFGTVICTVRVVENLLTNACGMSAATVAEIILKSLTGFTAEGASAAWAPRPLYPWYQQVGTTTTNVVEITVITSMDI